MGDERATDFTTYRRRELGLEHVSTRFGALQRAAEPERKQQAEQLERVSHRIAGAILGFFATRAPGTEFHADDLRRHVAGQCGQVAPDSARRVASELKAKGRINFACISRAQSLFRVLETQPRQPGDGPC